MCCKKYCFSIFIQERRERVFTLIFIHNIMCAYDVRICIQESEEVRACLCHLSVSVCVENCMHVTKLTNETLFFC